MESFDVLIIGGGINGAAIARDASARGQRVLLVEKDDLASHTSSASSKLIHGGLRYLEYLDFRLVREGLKERAILLKTAPHIVRPLSFVLPHADGMRPWWMLRMGLALYDLMGLRGGLPRARGIKRSEQRFRSALKSSDQPMALYWDGWVDDARLVVLNALGAAEHGAEIATRTELVDGERREGRWIARLSDGRTIATKTIVNAAGAWVTEVLGGRLRQSSESRVRLVRGSHIVVPRLYDGEHAYILQQPDKRVVFALPYGRYTLVGTTDVPAAAPDDARAAPEEIDYLCAAINGYFRQRTDAAQIVWSYAGIRALYDDGAGEAQAVTRDYHLELDDRSGARLLSIFGGKITTARALAEEALDRLGIEGRKITDAAALPGGDIYPAFNDYLNDLSAWLPAALLLRLSRAYGTRLKEVLGGGTSIKELGRHFGAGLYEAEVRYLAAKEFARTSEDIIWRRTKLGLEMSDAEKKALAKFLRDDL